MSKIIFSFLILIFNFPCLSIINGKDFSYSQTQYYAKIQTDSVYLYTQPNQSDEFKLFCLPTSYFVLLTAEANNDFYSCKYGDINGYVKKEEVTAMNGTPVSPYANFASFRVFSLDGLEMRSTPYKTPLNILTKVNYLEDNLIYYGSIEGDELIPKKSKTWYYCKYINDNDIYYGYLNSTFCDELSEIPLNMETFTKIEGTLFPVKTQTQPPPSSELSGTAKTLIIIGVSLPCVLILYLLIKPTLILERTDKKKAKSKRKRGDYFEFDENDLT